MNWYQIFYWVNVADNVTIILGTIAILSLIIWIISTIGFFASNSYLVQETKAGDISKQSEDYNEWLVWKNAWKKYMVPFAITCIITSILWALTPTKKQALTIIAGGAVGNFITSDSSARQIPASAMQLLNEEIKSEIKDIKNGDMIDTLQNKSKEELIQMLKNK